MQQGASTVLTATIRDMLCCCDTYSHVCVVPAAEYDAVSTGLCQSPSFSRAPCTRHQHDGMREIVCACNTCSAYSMSALGRQKNLVITPCTDAAHFDTLNIIKCPGDVSWSSSTPVIVRQRGATCSLLSLCRWVTCPSCSNMSFSRSMTKSQHGVFCV